MGEVGIVVSGGRESSVELCVRELEFDLCTRYGKDKKTKRRQGSISGRGRGWRRAERSRCKPTRQSAGRDQRKPTKQ